MLSVKYENCKRVRFGPCMPSHRAKPLTFSWQLGEDFPKSAGQCLEIYADGNEHAYILSLFPNLPYLASHTTWIGETAQFIATNLVRLT